MTGAAGSDAFDVAIVGASIAGCTAATLLARRGARVALIERREDPQAFKRICTHYIQGSASPTLERLGLRDTLVELGARPSGTNVWTRYGWISFAPEWASSPEQRRHPGWNIRRETLDPLLRELAMGTDGVEPLLGLTAVELLRDGDDGRVSGVVVRGRDGAERTLRASVVVAADGRGSAVARLAGARGRMKPHRRFGYFAYYRDTPLVTGSSNQLWLQDPDVAYAFPTDGGLTLLVCTPHMARLPEFRRDPEQAMRRTFERLADAPRLDPAKREGKVLGKIETPNVLRPPSRPGLALVGDAAVEADPVWGVGCGWALQSAEWLADALGPALGGGEAEIDRALRRYAWRHRRHVLPHEQIYAGYSIGRRFNPLERIVYRAAARDREVAATMAAVGARWIVPQRMAAPRMLARLAAANLARGREPLGLRVEG